jgi:HlyD family secretion protein
VEEVFATDGALVAKGQLLFRISNPQRNLELLARQSEHAVSIFNLSNLRVSQEASASDHQRRLADLQFALDQTQKQHTRNVKLAAQGYISAVALEESADRLAQQQRALQQEQQAAAAETRVRRSAEQQLESAIQGLSSGLKLVSATVDALAVRAPVAGRLTNFRLQVGESIATGKKIGRIDDPAAGWKGRGLWTSMSTYAPWHMEGGKGSKSKAVKLQIRPDPLAK